jgi:hypothetical protein
VSDDSEQKRHERTELVGVVRALDGGLEKEIGDGVSAIYTKDTC